MNQLPRCTLQDFRTRFAGRHLLHRVIDHWAAVKPDRPAFIDAGRDCILDWAALRRSTAGMAAALFRLGFRKGDYLAAAWPFLTEQVLLEYACFRLGVIHAPLDPRLKPAEVIRCLEAIRPRGLACLDPALAAHVREACPWVQHLLHVSEVRQMAWEAPLDGGDGIGENDPALVIFTTGSTGAPKPALLSHANITCQNMCLGAAFAFGERTRLLVNLPPSHVGGQTELLMTTLFWGGTPVVLEAFDAARSLEAVERYGVNVLGQIPTMFQMEWRLSGYGDYNLKSLEGAFYGGQQVARPFLERLARMAPRIGTGLGLTESAGFCTYTPPDASVDDLEAGIGFDMPVYPMSIREPMRDDGAAGAELADGETGHICFRGPQTFLGYAGNPEATSRTISTDGYLYTGDMGFKDARGLHFSGRAKWVIKTAGYQVFPGEVESHFCALDKVAAAGVVGVPHELFSEAVVAFVEPRPGVELTVAELKHHARAMAGYLRPLRYVILEPGQMPLNRLGKTDYVRLSALANKSR